MALTQCNQYTVSDASKASTENIDDSSLVLDTTPIPLRTANDVLVRIHAVSLKFRDIMIASGTYIWPVRGGVVPCSDGAGEVVSIGEKVTQLAPSDKVATFFNQAHLYVVSRRVTPTALSEHRRTESSGSTPSSTSKGLCRFQSISP